MADDCDEDVIFEVRFIIFSVFILYIFSGFALQKEN